MTTDLSKQFYYKRNCLQQLKGFCNTVQEGGISKAAEKMGLTQSTITLQIQSLERDLKTKLFDRDKKRMRLNRDGEIFYGMVTSKLSGIESLYAEFLARKNQQPLKTINIATHHVIISYLLPPYIKKFQEQNPDVKIGIKSLAPNEAVKRLQDNEVDIIIYPNIKPSEEFRSYTCFSYDPVLIMHQNHPLAKKKNITLQDISEHNTIRVDQKLLTLPLFEEIFKEFNFKTNIEFENGSWEMIKSFVKAQIGLGFVSKLYLTKDDDDIVCKDLSKFFPKTEYQLVVKNGKILSNLTKDFIKILTNGKNLEGLNLD